MKRRSKTISLKYFGLFKFENIVVRENKYAQKLVFDRCAKTNTCEINRMSNARKLVRIRCF